MDTRVLLIRPGVTDWHEQSKLVGQRDRPLSAEGKTQAQRVADALAGVPVTELLCSPLQRAVQTGQAIERQLGLDMARDQRLTALAFGPWEGRRHDELEDDPSYQQFLHRPTEVQLADGSAVESVRRRAVAAVEQAIGNAAAGDILAIVTHSAIIRMLLGHYLGAPMHSHARLQVDPASISVMAFGQSGTSTVTAVNWHPRFGPLLDRP